MKNVAKLLQTIPFLFRQLIAGVTISDLVLDRLFAEKRAHLKKIITLNEKERTVFWPLYDDYEKNRAYSFSRYVGILKKYTQEHKNLPNAKAEELMREILALQTNDLKARQAHFKKLNEKLPNKKVFKYFVFEERVEAGIHAFVLKELPEVK